MIFVAYAFLILSHFHSVRFNFDFFGSAITVKIFQVPIAPIILKDNENAFRYLSNDSGSVNIFGTLLLLLIERITTNLTATNVIKYI